MNHAQALFDQMVVRRTAYLAALDSDSGKTILKDLREFCGADRDLFAQDAREHAYYEGRRSVFLHIAAILGHTTEDLKVLSGLNQESQE